MKTKIASLAILIPAVVLAQPAPQAQAPILSPPQMSMEQGTQSNTAKAAAALNNAKKQAKNLKGESSSDKDWTNTHDGKCPDGYVRTGTESAGFCIAG